MIEIVAEKRDIFGKKLAKSRAEGKLPVVVYGSKDKSASYFVSISDFKKVFSKAGESSVVAFRVGDETKDVLIHEVDFEPVKGEPVHADFYAIAKGQKVDVAVPIVFTGVAPAVKELSGILVKVMHELEIEAEPKNLPHQVEADISGLVTFDDQLMVKDIVLPAGVKSVLDPEDVIALVQAPKEEKEEESAPIDLSQIEVEKKGKKPEDADGEEGQSAE